ncbi:MAG: cytidine deaminase [Deltaproteobacteria bacterium]|nr:cytidine deaminase [Deltaproteobacteria bacterium]
MTGKKIVKQDALIKAAQEARKHVYAPFSKYRVGAAVLTSTGEIFSGCNVENSSYRLTNCAEVTALTKAVSEGYSKFVKLAVVTDDGGYPCGACRQVIWELCGDIEVLVVDKKGRVKKERSAKLLPHAFKLNVT